MSDDPIIDSVHRRDRSTLNIGGRQQRSKLIWIPFVAIIVLSCAGGGYYAVQQYNAATAKPPLPPTSPNLNFDNKSSNAGTSITAKSMTTAQDDDALLLIKQRKAAQIKAAQEKEAARLKAIQDAEKKRQLAGAGNPPPIIVTRQGHNRNTPLTPAERKMTGSVMVNFDGDNTVKPEREHNYDPTFDASHFQDGFANLHQPPALDFLLQHGTSIGCALYTQIISDYQGIVTCRVISDIYSANGAALLIEKGSVITGTQHVAMTVGKARIFTNWADIETPNGVSIQIDSLGAGATGASGSAAWVDDHFSQRFGGAIMLSFVDDALATAASNASKNTSDVSIDNSTSNVSDMASKALDTSINIAPTGYSQIGQRINILVARDIDLSTVYQFQRR